MASTFTNLLYHIVYSTKYRNNLVAPQLQAELYPYIGGIVQENRGTLLEIGGMPDHVQLLAQFSPTIAVSDMLRLIKTNSSKWVNERDGTAGRFEWQTGYAAFSVSQSQADTVRQYIRRQEEHHRSRSFTDEFRRLLQKHNIDFDERYLFEETHIA
ncbi:MAG: IS200/IS605 family transposase [Planctomycetia bacterium]|nr:IS200/IS605 family transposase [Planctomycetia bacterium]